MKGDGYQKLWGWFGLSRASFLVLPRVMMHDMPDEWQGKMADLLNEYDEIWNNAPDYGTRVQCLKDGKMVKWDRAFLNYRHPDYNFLDSMKARIYENRCTDSV